MSIASVKTAAIVGCKALPVTVEVILKSGGMPKFTIIGLADSAIKESKDRVMTALQQCGFKLPEKILVSLSPAELKKEGSSFDLPIALGILVALKNQFHRRCADIAFHGELGLDGSLKGIRGGLLYALGAGAHKISTIGIPRINADEASVVKDVSVLGFSHILEVVDWLTGVDVVPTAFQTKHSSSPCGALDDVIGQEKAKRALTIAAAGGHNLLFVGPPGCGKSMLSSRLPSILPKLNDAERIECGMIHSAYGLKIDSILTGYRPFRSPHYSISDIGLIGGGPSIKPGEISLAHQGVLFLDEFPEFRRAAVEALRTPMEAGEVHVARAKGSIIFPARFQLIAAMNPCPCGRLGSTDVTCVCSAVQIQRYLKQLSQPILDRIDLHVEMHNVGISEFMGEKRTGTPDSEVVKRKISEAREIQFQRQEYTNAAFPDVQSWKITENAQKLLLKAVSARGYSARVLYKLVRVARTICDLENHNEIQDVHIAEALSLRALDKIASYIGLSMGGSSEGAIS